MTSSNPNTYVIQPKAVMDGTPPASSYWVGASREELAAQVAARRHQQAIARQAEVRFDPSLAATVSLMVDHRMTRGRK